MVIIRGPIAAEGGTVLRILLAADRATLSKRRWRGAAEDGREFGFDLEKAMGDETVFFRDGEKAYVIAQKAEAVLEVRLGDAVDAARVGWMIGNLHFQIELGEGAVFAVDDPATRGLFDREGIPFARVERVFKPVSAVTHGHH